MNSAPSSLELHRRESRLKHVQILPETPAAPDTLVDTWVQPFVGLNEKIQNNFRYADLEVPENIQPQQLSATQVAAVVGPAIDIEAPTFMCVGPSMTLKGDWIVPLESRIEGTTDMGFLFRLNQCDQNVVGVKETKIVGQLTSCCIRQSVILTFTV